MSATINKGIEINSDPIAVIVNYPYMKFVKKIEKAIVAIMQ